MTETDKSPIVPVHPPLKGMIVPKFGGLVKIGRGAKDGNGNPTDSPVAGPLPPGYIEEHNQKILEESQKSEEGKAES